MATQAYRGLIHDILDKKLSTTESIISYTRFGHDVSTDFDVLIHHIEEEIKDLQGKKDKTKSEKALSEEEIVEITKKEIKECSDEKTFLENLMDDILSISKYARNEILTSALDRMKLHLTESIDMVSKYLQSYGSYHEKLSRNKEFYSNDSVEERKQSSVNWCDKEIKNLEKHLEDLKSFRDDLKQSISKAKPTKLKRSDIYD